MVSEDNRRKLFEELAGALIDLGIVPASMLLWRADLAVALEYGARRRACRMCGETVGPQWWGRCLGRAAALTLKRQLSLVHDQLLVPLACQVAVDQSKEVCLRQTTLGRHVLEE